MVTTENIKIPNSIAPYIRRKKINETIELIRFVLGISVKHSHRQMAPN